MTKTASLCQAITTIVRVFLMKQAIHPTYFPQATITCACGSSQQVGSTLETISVELCNRCHPYYSGTQKILDAAGRVERFHKRAAKQQKSET